MGFLDALRGPKPLTSAKLSEMISEEERAKADALAVLDQYDGRKKAALLAGDDAELDRLEAEYRTASRRVDTAEARLELLRQQHREAEERQIAARRAEAVAKFDKSARAALAKMEAALQAVEIARDDYLDADDLHDKNKPPRLPERWSLENLERFRADLAAWINPPVPVLRPGYVKVKTMQRISLRGSTNMDVLSAGEARSLPESEAARLVARGVAEFVDLAPDRAVELVETARQQLAREQAATDRRNIPVVHGLVG